MQTRFELCTCLNSWNPAFSFAFFCRARTGKPRLFPLREKHLKPTTGCVKSNRTQACLEKNTATFKWLEKQGKKDTSQFFFGNPPNEYLGWGKVLLGGDDLWVLHGFVNWCFGGSYGVSFQFSKLVVKTLGYDNLIFMTAFNIPIYQTRWSQNQRTMV